MTPNSCIKTRSVPAIYAAHLMPKIFRKPANGENHLNMIMVNKTYFWDGSWAKKFLAFSYVIGRLSSIKSDKSMSKVGARLLNSDPNDIWEKHTNKKRKNEKDLYNTTDNAFAFKLYSKQKWKQILQFAQQELLPVLWHVDEPKHASIAYACWDGFFEQPHGRPL